MAAVNQPTAEDHPPAPPEYEDPQASLNDAPPEQPGDDEPGRAEATLPPIADPTGELEELEDRSMPVDRVLWAINREGVRIEQTYTQKGLSWFGKLELYGLLGQAVKVVLEGDNPLGINTMLDAVQSPTKMFNDLIGSYPGADTVPDRPDVTEDMEVEAGKIMAALAQVVALAPDLLTQAYCVVLAIPKTHRNWAIEWAFPNMDDEMGRDILHVFVDQNWGVMEDFFVQELPKIIKRIVKARRSSAGLQ